jgi:hypothetical protein
MQLSASHRIGGDRRVWAAVITLVVVMTALWPADQVSAATPVDARAAALSVSATCSLGDIEITYTGVGVERQITSFTSADRVEPLHLYDVHTYSPVHDGLEYILSQTRTPPPPGTIVAVYSTIGSSPPDPASTGEFFVAWRCDDQANSRGGNNVVIETCVGLYGSCPRSARELGQTVPRFSG